MQLAADEPISRGPKDSLSEKKIERISQLNSQLEKSKFIAYVSLIEKTYHESIDLKLREMLALTLFEINAHHTDFELQQPIELEDPVSFLIARTDKIAQNYISLHKIKSGDHKDDSEHFVTQLKNVLETALDEFKIPEYKKILKADTEWEEFLKTTAYAKKVFPFIRVMNTYPAHMIDDLFESHRNAREVPLYLCHLYKLGIANNSIKIPNDKEKQIMHEEILLRAQQFQKQIELQNESEQHRHQHLQMAILYRFTDFLEKAYQKKLDAVFSPSQQGSGMSPAKFFKRIKSMYDKTNTQSIKTPEEYIHFLNNNSGHHLHRMIVMTLDQIYRCYGHLLPRGHQQKITSGIQHQAQYQFQSPVREIRGEVSLRLRGK